MLTFGNQLYETHFPQKKEEPPPPPPKIEEPKVESVPCEVQRWRSFDAPQSGSSIHYAVKLFSLSSTSDDCIASLTEETYGIYRGKSYDAQTGKKRWGWGINSKPSSSKKTQVSYRTETEKFKTFVDQTQRLPRENQKQIFKKIDQWVHQEMKP